MPKRASRAGVQSMVSDPVKFGDKAKSEDEHIVKPLLSVRSLSVTYLWVSYTFLIFSSSNNEYR